MPEKERENILFLFNLGNFTTERIFYADIVCGVSNQHQVCNKLAAKLSTQQADILEEGANQMSN